MFGRTQHAGGKVEPREPGRDAGRGLERGRHCESRSHAARGFETLATRGQGFGVMGELHLNLREREVPPFRVHAIAYLAEREGVLEQPERSFGIHRAVRETEREG